MDKDAALKNFKIIIDTTKNINLRIFLDGGTLLGAIRGKDFIGHDSDFDFGVLRSEFSDEIRRKLVDSLTTQDIAFKGYEAPCFEINNNKRPHMLKFWGKYGKKFNIDFFIFEKHKNFYYHKAWGGIFYFKNETLDSLDEIEFKGMKVLVPHNPELYLEVLYGKDWKTPKSMKKPDEYANFTKFYNLNLNYKFK